LVITKLDGQIKLTQITPTDGQIRIFKGRIGLFWLGGLMLAVLHE